MRFRLLVVLSLILALAAVPAVPSAEAAPAKKRKCRAGYVLKTVKKGKGRKARKVKRCVRRAPKRKAPVRTPVVPGQPQSPQGPQPQAQPQPQPQPQAPVVHAEPVRDDVRFAEVLANSRFYRTYNPGNATHEEKYDFCPSALHHYYEGIAHIYQARGPWKVIEGNINTAGDKASGVIEYTQQSANFEQEVGKVQRIEIKWSPNPLVPQWSVAQIKHPEIGSYEFDRSHETSGQCG